ncbi:MAG: ABC transporter ATP-binding protein [Candidatus Brocadiales bacterium]
MTGPLLRVKDLKTYFFVHPEIVRAVDGVSFDIKGGRTLAVVGESGCGKSAMGLSILRLVPRPPGKIVGGQIRFKGKTRLLALPEKAMRRIRGDEISMIFQDPLSSLNPLMTIGEQVMETILLHTSRGKRKARDDITEMFARVGLPDPEEKFSSFPFELSGGMRQRVMIAMALACNPALLIADEPTTALDVTIQAQIIALLKRLQRETGMAVLLITHNLGIVAEIADDVAVMYAGKLVEYASVRALFGRKLHPYTRGLFKSLPQLSSRGKKLYSIAGFVPDMARLPRGCRFEPRCPDVHDRCRKKEPELKDVSGPHKVACWLYE